MVLLVGRVGVDDLDVSDGWYTLPSTPFTAGDPLHRLVANNNISQGTKLIVQVSRWKTAGE